MVKKTWILVISLILLSGLFCCVSEPYVPDSIAAGTRLDYWLPDGDRMIGFSMHFVPHKEFFGIPSGRLEPGYIKIRSSFWIAETETTWELWKMVYDWAIAHGYTFANPGAMGGGVGTVDNQNPVTMINRRDAIIWCNALTEYWQQANPDFECVYYSDSTYMTPLRDSRVGAFEKKANMAKGSFDNPFVNPDARGYRLPEYNEWSLAAQFVADMGNDGVLELTLSEIYPWNFASGAYAATPTELDKVAWHPGNSGGHSHAVKGKRPDALGLYDMNGNVTEWCYTYPGIIYSLSVARGRGWKYVQGETASRSPIICIYSNTHLDPFYAFDDLGFRFARTH